jgi:transposase
MNVRYRVDLSQIERDELRVSVSGGKQPVRRLKRMQILLAADAGVSDKAIEASVQTSGSTIYRTKKRFVEISLEAALSEEPRPGAARKLSGKDEVQLVALACSDPPEGCTRWTLTLLANALLEVVEHESISRETIRRRLDDNDLKPWQRKMWCIAKIDGEYIARMEDLLDLYAELRIPTKPAIDSDLKPASHSDFIPAGVPV